MKTVVIGTHGFSVYEGTQIACYAFAAREIDSNASYAFVYDDVGKLQKAFEAKHHNPVKDLFSSKRDDLYYYNISCEKGKIAAIKEYRKDYFHMTGDQYDLLKAKQYIESLEKKLP